MLLLCSKVVANMHVHLLLSSGRVTFIASIMFCIGFVETPMSLIVTIGAESHFRCRHPNSDGILWSVNGTFLRNLPDSLLNFVAVQDSGHTLTVTADPQLNISSIQCLAIIVNGPSVYAPPVTLEIQGVLTH